MLENELSALESLLKQRVPAAKSAVCSEEAIEAECARIRQAWQKAVFADVANQALKRYFQVHLNSLARMSGTASYQLPVLGLIGHMLQDYPDFFAGAETAPKAYHQLLAKGSESKWGKLKEVLARADIPARLQVCLLGYLDGMTERDPLHLFSFRSLFYFLKWVDRINDIGLEKPDAEARLIDALYELNFNHLVFFDYYKNKVQAEAFNKQDKLLFLQRAKCEILANPVQPGMVYDPDWPSLQTLVGRWFKEVVLLTESSIGKEQSFRNGPEKVKLPLQLSVSHLAFLVRLFYEESQLNTQNLTFVFKFISGHFSTKRQPAVSPGSLSKEYYSTDQHTAARVRDLLQKMIARINRNFFPVLAAANVITAALAGML